jgi:hypothetical protein
MESASEAPAGRSAEDVTEVLAPEGGLQSSASVADAADLSMQMPATAAGAVLVEPSNANVRMVDLARTRTPTQTQNQS